VPTQFTVSVRHKHAFSELLSRQHVWTMVMSAFSEMRSTAQRFVVKAVKSDELSSKGCLKMAFAFNVVRNNPSDTALQAIEPI
jgi:hypothetical protein